MSTVNAPAEQRVVFYDVSWETYLALAAGTDRPGKRIAYDQGVMEIMSPGKLHEDVGRLIGRMVEAFTEELEIDAAAVKSTTFRRSDERRGFEADESFYITNESVVRGKDDIDLATDPPPDLVIEIDISRSSMNKFPIFGGLEVPEVWIFDGESLIVYVRTQGAIYEAWEHSAVLPAFPLEMAARCLEGRHDMSQTELIREFRKHVREQVKN